MDILHAYDRHRDDRGFSIFCGKILKAGRKRWESAALGYGELASDVFPGMSYHYILRFDNFGLNFKRLVLQL